MAANQSASRRRRAMWRQPHHLGRMSWADLVDAFVRHPTIQVYVLLIAASLALFASRPVGLERSCAIVALLVLAYPLVWYVLHRWVLHSRWMFKVPALAPLWKRIHYDHHLDPDHLEVLLGALQTTLPTVLLISALPGWSVGGSAGACLGFATGVAMTAFYEFCHCVQHLGYKPRHKMLALIKARHMEHHFHDENGNFGITNFVWDRLFDTYYTRPERPTKSPTVFNLGYDEAMSARYPAVAALSRKSLIIRRTRRRAGEQ